MNPVVVDAARLGRGVGLGRANGDPLDLLQVLLRFVPQSPAPRIGITGGLPDGLTERLQVPVVVNPLAPGFPSQSRAIGSGSREHAAVAVGILVVGNTPEVDLAVLRDTRSCMPTPPSPLSALQTG